MKLPGIIVLASLTLHGAPAAWAADATSPLDPAQRNAPYSPAPSVAPDKKSPEANATVQEKRVEKNVVEKKPAAVGDRRAAIDVKESRDKTIRDKDSHRPETVESVMSALNHREAPMSTAADANKPQLMTKYQEGLSAAGVVKVTNTSAADRATAAKINRFVFRKNAPDPTAALEGAAITPAAGGTAGRGK